MNRTNEDYSGTAESLPVGFVLESESVHFRHSCSKIKNLVVKDCIETKCSGSSAEEFSNVDIIS